MLLPYGVDTDGHVVVAVGREVIDVSLVEGLDVDRRVFGSGSLDQFITLGPGAWDRTRAQLQRALTGGGGGHDRLARPAAVAHDGPEQDEDGPPPHLGGDGRRPGAGLGRRPVVPAAARRATSDVHLVRPWTVGDYADFYASRQHVEAMGRMLRPGDDPLPPAWLHLPIGYHGRAGTVIVSGQPVYRPWGIRPDPAGTPIYGPSMRLDVEVELGFVVGVGVERGRTITAPEAERHLFGMVVLNDWSARDIQAFEYRPLGPFLGKSFATSISPWVVPMAALEPYRAAGPVQDPEPTGYLKAAEPRGFDIRLQLSVNDNVISRMSSSGLYWSPAQMLAHLTANGAGVRAGDLFGTGTISGPDPGGAGSLMEHGQGEWWLADGDEVTMSAWCGDESAGAVTGRVEPRRPEP